MILPGSFNKFKIEIAKPELFSVSQWDQPGMLILYPWIQNLCIFEDFFLIYICDLGLSSVWFLTYKVLVTVLMLTITSAHIAINLHRLGWKWIIFLTNQGLLLIILHNILHLTLILWSDQPLRSLQKSV